MLNQENNYAVRRTTIAFALLAGIAVVTFAAAPSPAHAQDLAPCEQAQKKEKKGSSSSASPASPRPPMPPQ